MSRNPKETSPIQEIVRVTRVYLAMVVLAACSRTPTPIDDSWLDAICLDCPYEDCSGWSCQELSIFDSLTGQLAGPDGALVEFEFEWAESEVPDWSLPDAMASSSFWDDDIQVRLDPGNRWTVAIFSENPLTNSGMQYAIYSFETESRDRAKAVILGLWHCGSTVVHDRWQSESTSGT